LNEKELSEKEKRIERENVRRYEMAGLVSAVFLFLRIGRRKKACVKGGLRMNKRLTEDGYS